MILTLYITTRLEPAFRIGWGDHIQSFANCLIQLLAVPGLYSSQYLLYLAPHLLYWIEIRAIFWQKHTFCASRNYHCFDTFGLMNIEIIHHDDIIWMQTRYKEFFHICFKYSPIQCSFEYHAARFSICPKRGKNGSSFPATIRSMIQTAAALQGSPIQSGHIGFCSRFIQKNKP